MATWKVKGVVPDSDDEDELDSQSITGSIEGHGGEFGGESQVPERRTEKHGLSFPLADNKTVYDERIATTALEKSVPKSNIDSLASSLQSSPLQFKDPRALFDLEDGSGGQSSQQTIRSAAVPGLPLQEEISTTYAQLTSPMSSPLSSLSGSQFDSPPKGLFEDRGNQETSQRQPIISIPEAASLAAFEGRVDYSARNFRQRNPIQLHPYIVEQERYRQTLKSRGMTPIRLALPSQEHPNKSRHISEEPESQEFELESQTMDIDSNPILPSSTQSTSHESREDDEFPDIDELFQQRPHRLKQNSSKSRKFQLTKKSVKEIQPIRLINREDSIFDVPASPPQTSSPLPSLSHGTRGFTARPRSHSPGILEEDELAPENLHALPTPVTSVIKPVSDPIFIESASDGDDPFATERSASPSSDESVEIRKISKRFRGVLPASHLRLDHLKKSKIMRTPHRESMMSASTTQPIRRGVALPRATQMPRTDSPSTSHAMPIFSDDSDEGEDETSPSGFVMQDEDSSMLDIFSEKRLGIAEEDDRVDAMLPSSRKRQERRPATYPRKRRQFGSTSVQKHLQPRITDHLITSQTPDPPQRRKNQNSSASAHHSHSGVRRPRNLNAPRLGILDVLEVDNQGSKNVPQFIRLAARASRSKRDHGRQSPSMKFIRLASRNDTQDAQTVLQNWRDGNIRPRDLRHLSRQVSVSSQGPLNHISDNGQTRTRPSTLKTYSRALPATDRFTSKPRKLVIARAKQSSMNDYITSESALPGSSQNIIQESGPSAPKRQEKRPYSGPKLRPAQLEVSETDYSQRHPATAFRSRKRVLDNLYRVARRRRAPLSNIQLSRFLADEDASEATLGNKVVPSPDDSATNATHPVKVVSKGRKRPPQRMDIGAAVYRQPSEPLILEVLAPTHGQLNNDEENRLQGLAKYGTRYTVHFDVFPLQPGIFFHASTFIGSGRLLEVLKSPSPWLSDVPRTTIAYHLGEKAFEWGPWNELVSSDLGVCFDWVIDQLNEPLSPHLIRTEQVGVLGMTTFVIDYVQHHLSFTDIQQQDTFFLRIIVVVSEALGRLYPKTDNAEEPQLRSKIEVTSMLAVFVMQLLRISQSQPSQLQITSKLEELLLKTADHCIGFLLCKGFECIRKLYDDLQYLSFRANGIKKEQYVLHSWVILIKILQGANIPRGSFWDVANKHLLGSGLTALNDARSMEQTWYSLFTLLPLCEFDESGVVISGQRQSASFDNWAIPTKMLKSVFALYSSGSTQSPSFNDYCRALVSRCHYLVTEWGWWKCNGIIGAIFDFFASHNLGHLRNEEVYKSPSFLEELNTEPALAVEPNDRCFHIFLKVVGVAIKHLQESNEAKNIRNLVFRLLPNHDRQYPREETLDTRDLASLRNHHDLLCTLYWAAPAAQRPSLTLIQELVDADRSHNAACLINLRAWQQLARFVFMRYSTPETFQPFLLWQNTFWSKILDQFLEEETNTRKEAALMIGALITERHVQETVARNQASTMALLLSSINALSTAVSSANSSDAAMAAFNTRIIKSVFGMSDHGHVNLTESLVADTIGVLRSYMNQIEKLHPFAAAQPPSTTGDDSQGSLGISMNMDRQPLSEEVLPSLRNMTNKVLEIRLYPSKEPSFMVALVEALAQAISLATEESSTLKSFLPGGANAIFQRRSSERAIKYWPLFLGELLRYKSIQDLEDVGFDIGLEWMLTLAIPMPEPNYLNRLTLPMFEKKHLLAKDFPSVHVALQSPSLATGWLSRHLIQGAIDVMRETLKGSTQSIDRTSTSISFPPKSDFSYILTQVLNSMQHALKAMKPASAPHMHYLPFCQGVAEDIRSRGSEIAPLTEFFITPSVYFWPAESDPKLFAAGIISYSLRLHDQTGRTSSELFHYLYRGWRNDLIHDHLKNHVRYVKKALKHWSFTEFTLTDLIPAALHAGFNSDFGWVICSSYLPPLADRVSKILDRDGPESGTAIGHLGAILKVIINGCMQQYTRRQRTIEGIHPLHRGIVTVGCQFWLALLPAIKGYVDRHPEASPLIQSVNNALTTFAQETVRAFNSIFEDVWEIPLFEIARRHRKQAADSMANDYEANWTLDQPVESAMQSRSGVLSIGGYGARESENPTVSLRKLWPPTLQQVLETGRPHFEMGSPCPLPSSVALSHRFLANIFF